MSSQLSYTIICLFTILFYHGHGLPVHQLSTSSSSRTVKLCPAGMFRTDTGKCKLCPPGTYRLKLSKQNKCEKCKAGTFQPKFGATTSFVCRPCYPGTFNKKEGARTCWKCPMNKTNGFGSTKCVRCKPGTHVSFHGAKCETCYPETFSTKFNSRICEYCIDGKTNKERTKCNSCKKGENCYQCPKSMFRTINNGCKTCPLGTTTSSSNIATSISDCKKCSKGYARGLYDSDCHKCKNGIKDAPVQGAMACKNDDGSCPYSFFLSKNGICITCKSGQFKNSMTKECQTCATNSVSEGGVQSSCTVCPQGAKPTEDNKYCTCGDGYHLEGGKCVACSAGTFRNDKDHVPNYGCEPCRPGWVSGKGAAKCTRCAYGSVASKNNDSCEQCPERQIPNLLNEIDLYYEYGQSKCVDGRSGN